MSAQPYCLEHALAYAARGFPVLPLVPGGKAPASGLVPHGFRGATTNLETVRHWYESQPECGLGIYTGTSNVLVLDVDDKPGKENGAASLRALEDVHGELPATLTQHTPTGNGRHLFFRLPEGVRISNATLAPGIDVRHVAGFVAAEPTIIDGKGYAFDDWEVLSGEAPSIANAPPWLLDRLATKQGGADSKSFPGIAGSPPLEFATPQTVTELRSALNMLDANDRETWISVGHALRGLGDVGRELWLTWSQQSSKWKPSDAQKWDGFAADSTSYRAVFKRAQELGWVNPMSKAATMAPQALQLAPSGGGLPSVEVTSADRVRDQSPAPQPLPPELLPVEAFPTAALPDAFRPWVEDVAERMHCPPDFVAVPMLVAAASLVARHLRIAPQLRTDWTECGNLWALIVGRPGWMKSPAMTQALTPMERLEARAAAEFKHQLAINTAEIMSSKLRAEVAVKKARAALKKDEDADLTALLTQEDEATAFLTRKRYVVNDLTYEKAGEILEQNPEGVLMVRDEMRGFLLNLAEEKSAAARGFFLQAWSGGRYTFDRILRGTVTVEDVRLSIIGGIQPGPLSDMVHQARRGAADDGMLERFLIAWPDAVGEWREVDRWPDSAAKRSAWGVFDRLDTLTAESLMAERKTDARGQPEGLPFVRFDDDAREVFVEWRAEFERTIRGAEGEGVEGALSKFRHHVPALALALHVIDGGQGAVTLQPTLRALVLADYFESHARRLHGSGRRAVVRAAHAVLGKARAGALPNPFTARDVYRNQWAGLSDKAAAADALDLLAAHGWLSEASVETGGRPTTVYSLTEGARRG